MDSYVRIYDEAQKDSDDNPAIVIILCFQKNKAIAKYSVLNDSKQIFASKYQLILATAQELEQYIEEEHSRIEEEEGVL